MSDKNKSATCPFCGCFETWFDRASMRTRCVKCSRAVDETEEPKPVGIRNALQTLGITGDVLFERIVDDLDRGLIREARAHLNFVDEIGKATESSPLFDLLRKFYETWIRCESTRGCYALCEPHDCRCPKGRGIGECYCGREELDRLRDLLNELSSKNDQAHRRQTPPERTI